MKRLIGRRSAGYGLADLLVVVALIPLVGVVMLGCRERQREPANRVRCAANLKSIGQALMLYAAENKGAYPRTIYAPGEKVIPTWGTGASATDPFKPGGPDPNDVTAAIFLLLTTQDSTPEVYVCPQSDGDKWDFGGEGRTAGNWSNWEGREGIRRHLSYSMQNPYADDAAVASGFKWNSGLGADYAIMADMNPGVSKPDANVVEMKSTDTSPAARRRGNSRNHDREGQNVLYGDGHVDFAISAFAGVNGDNIYARRAGPDGLASSDVRNSPFDDKDNVLLPTDD